MFDLDAQSYFECKWTTEFDFPAATGSFEMSYIEIIEVMFCLLSGQGIFGQSFFKD